MLVSLHIRDFVIVKNMTLDFSEGFTVFTGETGAGKSILIDALALALGGKADSFCIREGTDKTDITAVFDIPISLRDWCMEQQIDDDQIILRRTYDKHGKSRAWINGTPSTLSQLRQVGEYLVDIHGQHAHQGLLRTSAQRDLLDSQGQHRELAHEVQIAYKAWQQQEKILLQAQTKQAELAQEKEQLEWQLNEIHRLKLAPKEWQSLSEIQHRLSNASSLIEKSSKVLNILDSDNGLSQQLDQASRLIEQLLSKDSKLQSIYESLESARISCSEASSDLNHYLHHIDLEPEKLTEVETRMSEIFGVARRLHIEPEELQEKAIELEQRLNELEQASDINFLKAEVSARRNTWKKIADQLSQARLKTAKLLSQAVTKAMQTLAMQGGSFEVALTPCEPCAAGQETVEFLVAGHSGVAPKPLNKVASGGELARLSLALSVLANQAHRVPTLIFDEVDTGIGGAVAEVVGQLLRELGQSHQVLCVTHLPQVAAKAQYQWLVSKIQEQGHTYSSIQALDEAGRIEEIARMLGGVKITQATRNHAIEMLTPK